MKSGFSFCPLPGNLRFSFLREKGFPIKKVFGTQTLYKLYKP